MAEVVMMPGVKRESPGFPVEKVVDALVEQHAAFVDVVVIGKMPDGEMHYFSSSGDIDKVVGMTARALSEMTKIRLLTVPDER